MMQSVRKIGPIDNMRIGLFGGSFNPPHTGHFALAETALATLQLDYVWWLVSPQNPLKSSDQTADFDLRMAQTMALARHPRFVVTDIERQLNTSTTFETLSVLAPVFLHADFVWLMGADSFAGLHRWNNWREIPEFLPMAIFDRPGWCNAALASTAASCLGDYKLPVGQACLLAGRCSPSWTFVPMPQRPESSTRIRLKSWPFAQGRL
jgi:nicotinate-nucleotide adenylyltransferase